MLKEAFPEGTIMSLVFILVAADMYANGVTASQSFWIWSLGMIWAVPIGLLKAGATASPALGWLAALIGLVVIVLIKDSLGSGIWLAILSGSIIMALGV